MRRIIYATATAAVLASSSGCQQCWDSFRRFEAWKYQAVFGRSPESYDQVVAMPATVVPTTVAAPICQPIDACSPTAAIAVPATTIAPSPGCACSSGTTMTIPSLPGTISSGTTYSPGTIVTPAPAQ
jgi:hypothetical protein